MFRSVITGIVIFSVGIFSGLFVKGKLFPQKPIIQIVEKKEIITVPVYREYTQMSRTQLVDRLTCYDTGKPALDINISDGIAHLSAGLCDRSWSRDVVMQVNESGNWKMYAGVGAAAVIAAGLTVYFSKK